jgi:hypothetical protein
VNSKCGWNFLEIVSRLRIGSCHTSNLLLSAVLALSCAFSILKEFVSFRQLTQ